MDPKPKRELTEAQRLTFLKAQETRKKNIEARKQAKEQQKLDAREKRKQAYKKAKELIDTPEEHEEQMAPTPLPVTEPEAPQPAFDVDALSDQVVARIFERLEALPPAPEQPQPKPKKKRVVKKKAVVKVEEPQQYRVPYIQSIQFI